MKVTPRTDIQGAHQQGVFVKKGSKLGSRSLIEKKRFYAFLAIAVPFLLSDWIPSQSQLGQWKRKLVNEFSLDFLPSGFVFVMTVTIALLVYWGMTSGRPFVLFAYNCFIKPFFTRKPDGVDSEDHQNRLELFYKDQASVYDVTRKRLLRGRNTMLKLCAAQLRQVYPCDFTKVTSDQTSATGMSPPMSPTLFSTGKKFAWIDCGGGTGENIERMNQYFPISNFDCVYLVDITPSLCEIAKKRFKKLGWKNVQVLCMDAAQFQIPEQDGEVDIALITMSYSLTMIETYYPIVDRLQQVLAPTGIFGVADFYVSSKRSSDPTRQLSWFKRWFWAMWFDQDNVYLSPGRREYLEHKFKTVKTFSGFNRFLPLINIPYYIFVGAQKSIAF
jgi:betaine lipid synthase